jgi:hypothetical protein
MCWKGRLRLKGRGSPHCLGGGRARGLTPIARCVAPMGLAFSPVRYPGLTPLGLSYSAATRLLLGLIGFGVHLLPSRGLLYTWARVRELTHDRISFRRGDLVLLQCYSIALLVHCTIGVPLLSCACTRLLPFGLRPHERFSGGCYANHACLLRGIGICGGPLDF